MKRNKNFLELIKKMAVEWRWIFSYVRRYKLALFLYIFLGLVATVMSLGVSVAGKYLIDAVVSKVNDTIVMYGCLAIGLAVFQQIFQSATALVTAAVSSRTSNEIREDIYSNIINAQWEEIYEYHSGDLLNRLEADVQTISSAIINFIPTLITRTVQFAGALAIVVYYDRAMALIALAGAPFYFFSARFLINKIRDFSEKSRKLNGDVLSYSEESVQNLLTIKAFDLTKQYIENFKIVLEKYRATRFSHDKFAILLSMCLGLVGLAVSYSCYGWGVYRLWQNAITFGTMTMFIQLSSLLTTSFYAVAQLVPNAISIATSAGRVKEISTLIKEQDSDGEKAQKMYEATKNTGISLNFRNVSFQYKNGDSLVIKNASFTVNSGETVALVGPSGEGKTTVLKLLLGVVSPTEGTIELSAPNGEKLTVSDSTRRFCSYVPQGINIFSGTIRENLTSVKPNATDEELFEVIEAVSLKELIDSLPKGLDSAITEHGGNFSQGQMQRIAIARALLKDAPVILMDEATSALDFATEKRVLESIMKNDPTKICIMTTHRESMLKYCHKVFEVDSKGNIAQR